MGGAKLAASKHNLAITSTGKFKRGQAPEMPEVLKVTKTKPDAVIMVGTSNSLANFVKLAKENGLGNAEFHTVSFVGSGAFAKDLLSFKKGVENNVINPCPLNGFAMKMLEVEGFPNLKGLCLIPFSNFSKALARL